jgi:hypothetical protein
VSSVQLSQPLPEDEQLAAEPVHPQEPAQSPLPQPAPCSTPGLTQVPLQQKVVAAVHDRPEAPSQGPQSPPAVVQATQMPVHSA